MNFNIISLNEIVQWKLTARYVKNERKAFRASLTITMTCQLIRVQYLVNAQRTIKKKTSTIYAFCWDVVHAYFTGIAHL